MAQRNRFSGRRPQRTRSAAPPVAARPVWEKKAPVLYGKPFVLLEDEQKQTFVFQAGAWVCARDVHRRMPAVMPGEGTAPESERNESIRDSLPDDDEFLMTARPELQGGRHA